MDEMKNLPIVTDTSKEYLNQRQLLDYRNERENCLTWLLTFGKRTDEAVGYSSGTIRPTAYRMDRFYRSARRMPRGLTSGMNPTLRETNH